MTNDHFVMLGKLAAHHAHRVPDSAQELVLDLMAVHQQVPLDLERIFEDLDDPSVVHDVVGIWNHLDRKTKKLRDSWWPRYALKQ